MTIVHRRRARPTIRLLREDLGSDWDSPAPRRHISEGRFDELHPLSDLPHPIIAKAVNSFGDDPAEDNYVGPIASSVQLRLLEIKSSQWRGGVWWDSKHDVSWLVVAGLAKGGHEDHDDFYNRIARGNTNGDTTPWLPTDQDVRLLKRETAARISTDWECDIQRQLLENLRAIQHGGSTRFTVALPVLEKGRLATITIEVAAIREPDYEADEITVEITPERGYAGGKLLWQLTTRVLISLNPPDQGWDRTADLFSNIAEPGSWSARVVELETLTAQNTLAESTPGEHAHYTHQKNLAEKTVNGTAVRALCGAYFVPTQDHGTMPHCPTCTERWNQLPA